MTSCDHPDVTECDRCVLNFLNSNLAQEVNNRVGHSQVHQLLTLFKDVLNQRAIVSLASDGQVKFITHQAEQLLSQYFGCQEFHTLSACLKHWVKQQIPQLPSNGNALCSGIPLHIEKSKQQLIVYCILDPVRERYLLLMDEQELPTFSITALQLIGLTHREAEILFWIAKDKSNTEIAKVLGCCKGTVRKHLEHIRVVGK